MLRRVALPTPAFYRGDTTDGAAIWRLLSSADGVLIQRQCVEIGAVRQIMLSFVVIRSRAPQLPNIECVGAAISESVQPHESQDWRWRLVT